MKRSPQNWEEILDEIVSNTVLFFLVFFTTVAALNFISIGMLLSFYALYVIGLHAVACLLHKHQAKWEEQQHSSNPDLEQALTELRKSPEASLPEKSVDDLLKQSSRSHILLAAHRDLSKRRKSEYSLNGGLDTGTPIQSRHDKN